MLRGLGSAWEALTYTAPRNGREKKERKSSEPIYYFFFLEIHIQVLYINVHLCVHKYDGIHIYTYVYTCVCVISDTASAEKRRVLKECLPVCYQLSHPQRINCKLSFLVGPTFSANLS